MVLEGVAQNRIGRTLGKSRSWRFHSPKDMSFHFPPCSVQFYQANWRWKVIGRADQISGPPVAANNILVVCAIDISCDQYILRAGSLEIMQCVNSIFKRKMIETIAPMNAVGLRQRISSDVTE